VEDTGCIRSLDQRGQSAGDVIDMHAGEDLTRLDDALGGAVAGALVGSAEALHVVAGGALDVFVSDAQDRPLPATGFKGLAVVVSGGKPLRIPLTAVAPDRLSGGAGLVAGQPLKGVIQLTAPDGKPGSAKLD
jgi:hypothetical protein